MGVHLPQYFTEIFRPGEYGQEGFAVHHFAHQGGDLQADPVVIRLRRFAEGAAGCEQEQGRGNQYADPFSDVHSIHPLYSIQVKSYHTPEQKEREPVP